MNPSNDHVLVKYGLSSKGLARNWGRVYPYVS